MTLRAVFGALVLSFALSSMPILRAEAVSAPIYAGKCSAEQAKPDADGAAAETAALDFVRAIIRGDAAGVASRMTVTGRASASEVQIASALKAVLALGVVGEPSLAKAYILSLDPIPTTIQRVPCMSPDPNSEMDFVAAGPAAKQAYVLLTAATVGEGITTFTVWLQLDDGVWRVAAFHADPSVMGGRDGIEWWNIAKRQRQEGHDFNAALLYATAQNLLYRGPDYQLAIFPGVLSEARALTVPHELSGPFPSSWSLDGKTFRMIQVSVSGTSGGRTVLALVQSSDFATNADADRQNHALIDAFDKAHPEWREVFNWLAARTCEPDNSRCFGSVYDRNDGYLNGPPH